MFDAWTSEEVMRRWWHAGHDWIWDDDAGATRQLIEIDFEESAGATTVKFTHSGLWDQESVRSHEDGWGTAFDNLAQTLEA